LRFIMRPTSVDHARHMTNANAQEIALNQTILVHEMLLVNVIIFQLVLQVGMMRFFVLHFDVLRSLLLTGAMGHPLTKAVTFS